MSVERTRELCAEVGGRLDDELGQLRPQEVFASLGQIYLQAIATSIAFKQLEQAGRVRYASGKPGERQAQLRDWLWERASTGCSPVERQDR